MRRALAKNPANRYETCAEFVVALSTACNASGDWIPLPRGASQDLPTGGTRQGMTGSEAETLAETIAHPVSLPVVERVAAAAPPDPPAAAVSAPVLPPLESILKRQPEPSHTLRNVLLGVAGLAAGAVIAFMLSQRAGAPPVTPPVTAAPSPVVSAEPAPAESKTAERAAAAAAAPKPAPASPTAPAATEAAFQLTTNPAGAEAVFDGSADLHCTTPCSLNLPIGRHTLTLRHDGYRETQRVFTLPNDPGLIVSLEATTGTLSLVTNPPGLAIVVDGKEQARKTPASLPLPVGEHTVQVLKGSEKQEFVIEIRDGVLSQKTIDWQ